MPADTLTQIKDSTANPAPLGLLAFGMTTVLLNLHNAGFYELNSMILGMGIFYGGTAQVIAGIMEWKKKNTFATTAFISYGFFWLTLVALVVLPKIVPTITPTYSGFVNGETSASLTTQPTCKKELRRTVDITCNNAV